MAITPEELNRRVEEQIKQYGLSDSLITREALKNSIFISDALGEEGSFNHIKDMVEIPESMFIEYFLPTLLRPSLADKKGMLVAKVGGWQAEFKVISDQDRTILFVCPPLVNTLAFAEKVKWGDKEIDTNRVLTEMVEKSKLLIDTVIGTSKANELIDSLSNLVDYSGADDWQKRWYRVFARYSEIVSSIIAFHADEFKNKDGISVIPSATDSSPMSLDEFE